MTQLFELVKQTPWIKVKPYLIAAYPKSDAAVFEKHFLQLRYLEPQACAMRIILEKIYEETEDYVCVSGKDGTHHQETEDFKHYSESSRQSLAQEEVKFGLDFVPWEEWLGMAIDTTTLLEFDEPEIVAHCLWEMTFYGFRQSKIKAVMEDIVRQSQAIKNMTPEERATNLIRFEQLLEQIEP